MAGKTKKRTARVCRAGGFLLLLCLLFALLPGSSAFAEEQEDPWIAEEDWSDDVWDLCMFADVYSGDHVEIDTDEEHPVLFLEQGSYGTVRVGKHVQSIITGLTSVKRYEADEENPYLTAVDGVLFTKDMKKLVMYPCGSERTHYDVPAGVKIIGKNAFGDAAALTSVSLPLGLQQIGTYGFGRTGLTSVTLPVTVKRAGPCVFADCVNLVSVSASPSVSWGERAFDNCPLLDNAPFSGDEGGVTRKVLPEGSEDPGEYGYVFNGLFFHMAASPANAADKVYLYDAPDGKTPVKGYEWSCGDRIYGEDLLAYDDTWFRMDLSGYAGWDNDTGTPVTIEKYGYLKRSEVTLYPAETLFTVAGVRTADSTKLYSVENGIPHDEGKTLGDLIRMLKKEHGEDYDENFLRFRMSDIGWCTVSYGDYYYDEYMYEFRLADAVITREHTGDDKVFGVVAASDFRNRVNLRSSPSKTSDRIGRYFSNTQVEILEEQDDWYRVRVNCTEGWMMKEYVKIVLQADPS